MRKLSLNIMAITLILWIPTVLAKAQCDALYQSGNTWNLACSDDDTSNPSLDFGYQCQYTLALTTEAGFDYSVNASGSVNRGAQNVILWSEIQQEGSNIVSASIDSGSCNPW